MQHAVRGHDLRRASKSINQASLCAQNDVGSQIFVSVLRRLICHV